VSKAAEIFGAAVQLDDVTDTDRAAFQRELGRPPRGILAVAYRCSHHVPAVVLTAPRLEDGTPFPTMFYLCCKELNAAVSRMESSGLMKEMTDRLGQDLDLAAGYRRAHESYLVNRNALGDLGIAVTAGGMPNRVKCLHVLVAHSLAVGRGVNPLGDEAVDALGDYFRGDPPCSTLGTAGDVVVGAGTARAVVVGAGTARAGSIGAGTARAVVIGAGTARAVTDSS